MELNNFWIQDLKNRAQFEKELKYFQNLKAKPLVKKTTSGVSAVTLSIFPVEKVFLSRWNCFKSCFDEAAEEEVEAKDSETNDQSGPAEDPKKTLKKLRKRLRQITKLEEKLSKGETLNEDQQKKLATKHQIEESIASLESKIWVIF